MRGDNRQSSSTDFEAVNRAALAVLPTFWPDGCRVAGGRDASISSETQRSDRELGSVAINVSTGRWADFATGERGGDIISLSGFLHDVSQAEAARHLARMLGTRSDGDER